MNYKTYNRDAEQEKYKPITHVFAYKTGTFDGELPERKYELVPDGKFGLVNMLLRFAKTVITGKEY